MTSMSLWEFTSSSCVCLFLAIRPTCIGLGLHSGLSRPILENLGSLGSFKKLKHWKVRFLGFLGFLIFKSEFLLFQVKLCIGVDFGGSPGTCLQIIEKQSCIFHFSSPFASPNILVCPPNSFDKTTPVKRC